MKRLQRNLIFLVKRAIYFFGIASYSIHRNFLANKRPSKFSSFYLYCDWPLGIGDAIMVGSLAKFIAKTWLGVPVFIVSKKYCHLFEEADGVFFLENKNQVDCSRESIHIWPAFARIEWMSLFLVGHLLGFPFSSKFTGFKCGCLGVNYLAMNDSLSIYDRFIIIARELDVRWKFMGFLTLCSSSKAQELGYYCVVSPFSNWDSRQWPLDYFDQLIEHLSLQMTVVVIGFPIENSKNLLDKWRNNPFVIDKTGTLAFGDLVNILSGCQVLYCGDSGHLHIALSCGSRVKAIFGCVKPEQRVPSELRLDNEFFWGGAGCRFWPCYDGLVPPRCGHVGTSEEFKCLKLTRPEDVSS